MTNNTPETNSNPIPLIRISDHVFSVRQISKILLNKHQNKVEVFVDGDSRSFNFEEDDYGRAVSLFLGVSDLLRTSQSAVQFLYFSTGIFRFELIKTIWKAASTIFVHAGDDLPEAFGFDSPEIAQDVFDDLVSSLSLGGPSQERPPQTDEVPDDTPEFPQ